MQAGASLQKVQEVQRFRGSSLFSDRERAALELAEKMTITGEKVGDELFARVRGHFSEAETVELAATVALENFRSKFNVALGVEAQGFCMIPEAPSASG
jgi:alkylhydroperoxidase family enzyme